MIPGAPENKALPMSPLRIVHKMGFRPVIHCVCGASLDLNKAPHIAKAAEAFRAEHEFCQPSRERESMYTNCH